MKRLFVLFVIIIGCLPAMAQELMQPATTLVPLKELEWILEHEEHMGKDAKKYAAKTTASVFDTSTLNARINSWWGPGLPTAEKLAIFNRFWESLDSTYSCFVGLPMYNWDSIVNAMRTEIAGGVSKGRFAGILSRLTSYINDGHSGIYDQGLYTSGPSTWGRPLLQIGHGYGVCVTMLDDSTAMVYSANPGNTLGLQPGDRILGYNGIPWKTLLSMLLKYDIPISSTRASTDSATWHRYIRSVLRNWLMFDTLNIEKCDGALVNFPTSIMLSATSTNDFCTEQLEVPGVQTMTYADYYTNDKMVTWGVITGTRIGYVAFYHCGDMSGDSLLIPVKTLVEDSLVDGLILDIRTNFGGTLHTYYRTFKYLYEGDKHWMGVGYRYDPTARYTITPLPTSSYGYIDDDPHSFDKKIALLVGPGSISAGDVMQVMYTHHPNLKIIGKPTAGAFGGNHSVSLPSPGYIAHKQGGNFYSAEDNTHFLSHRNFPIDSFVWFDKASTCAGKDKVLETAIKWIKAELAVKDIYGAQASVNVYPNPSEGTFNILLQSPVSTMLNIALLNVAGIEVATNTATIITGENKLHLDFGSHNLPSGTYQLVIRGNDMETLVKKVTIVR